jgi:hypothetical protein
VLAVVRAKCFRSAFSFRSRPRFVVSLAGRQDAEEGYEFKQCVLAADVCADVAC